MHFPPFLLIFKTIICKENALFSSASVAPTYRSKRKHRLRYQMVTYNIRLPSQTCRLGYSSAHAHLSCFPVVRSRIYRNVLLAVKISCFSKVVPVTVLACSAWALTLKPEWSDSKWVHDAREFRTSAKCTLKKWSQYCSAEVIMTNEGSLFSSVCYFGFKKNNSWKI